MISSRKPHLFEWCDVSCRWGSFNEHAQLALLPPPSVKAITLLQCLRLRVPLKLPQFITKLSVTKVSRSTFSGNLVDQWAYKHMTEQQQLDYLSTLITECSCVQASRKKSLKSCYNLCFYVSIQLGLHVGGKDKKKKKRLKGCACIVFPDSSLKNNHRFRQLIIMSRTRQLHHFTIIISQQCSFFRKDLPPQQKL